MDLLKKFIYHQLAANQISVTEANDLTEFWKLLKNEKDFIRSLSDKRWKNVQEYLDFLNISKDEVIVSSGRASFR